VIISVVVGAVLLLAPEEEKGAQHKSDLVMENEVLKQRLKASELLRSRMEAETETETEKDAKLLKVRDEMRLNTMGALKCHDEFYCA